MVLKLQEWVDVFFMRLVARYEIYDATMIGLGTVMIGV